MSGAEFRDQVLGLWSSHPYWLERKESQWRLFALIPLGLVVLLAVLVVCCFDSFQPLFETGAAWVVALCAALVMATAVTLTVSLCRLMAEVQYAHDQRAPQDKDKVGFSWTRLIVVLAVGAVAPFVLSRIPALPRALRFCFEYLAVLPLIGTVLVLRAWGTPRKGLVPRRRAILLVLFLALLALLLAVLFSDLARLLAPWLPACPVEHLRWVAVMGLLPSALLALAAWWLWPVYVEPPVKEEPSTEEEGDGAPRRPPWLDDVLRKLPDCHIAGDEALTFPATETSPDSRRDDLKPLFGGLLPTQDQARLFERFEGAYREVIERLGAGSDPEGSVRSADLLVEGDSGSGRTTALVACAIYAAFVRGQRVLYLVPDEQRQEAVRRRIEAFLRNAHLHYYVSCGVVREDTVAGWLASARPAEQNAASSLTSAEPQGQPLPHILVSTLGAAEQFLYGHLAGGRTFEGLRRLILNLEVLIADDFMDFPDVQRSHLPFVLDKHRLLLESEWIPLQTVVVFPRLARIGPETEPIVSRILGERLFTMKRFSGRRNVLTLLPRANGGAWHVTLHVKDNLQAAIERLVGPCLQEDLCVVVYERGLQAQQKEQLLRKLLPAGAQGELQVISDLDQPLDGPSEKVDAVFYQVAVHEDACLALHLRMGRPDTVIFSILREGEEREARRDAGVVPVIMDRSAAPFLLTHLRSVLRFARPQTPILEDVWNQMGLDFADSKLRHVRSAGVPDARIHHDRLPDEGLRDKVPPYAVLLEGKEGEAPVRFGGLPDERREFFREAGRQSLFLVGHASDAASAGDPAARRALWRAPNGQVVREEDLAHARDLRLDYGGNLYYPQQMKRQEQGLILTAQPWVGAASPCLPVWEAHWEFHEPHLAEKYLGGHDQFVSWFRMGPKGTTREKVHVDVMGLMNEFAVEGDRQEVGFSYDARFSCLLLCPEKIPHEKLEESLGQGMAGPWGTHDEDAFWPELTGALNYAFEEHLPGALYFARVLAFRLDRKTPRGRFGPAAVWLVEPWSSGDTVMKVIDAVLQTPEGRAALFRSVCWALQTVQKHDDESPKCLRRLSRVGYGADKEWRDLDGALELSQSIVRCAELERAPDPVRVPTEAEDRVGEPVMAGADRDARDGDLAEKVRPWSECLDLLWSDLAAKFPARPVVDLSTWDHKVMLFVNWTELPDAKGQALAAASAPKGCEARWGGSCGLAFTPAGHASEADFKSGVEAWLRQAAAGRSFEPGTTMTLQLWVRKAEGAPDRQPEPGDPVNSFRRGACSEQGLILDSWRGPSMHTSVPGAGYILPEEPLPKPPEEESPPKPPGKNVPLPGKWKETLPDPEELRLGCGLEYAWLHEGKPYWLKWGFSSAASRKQYLRFLDRLTARIWFKGTHSYCILNDPYLDRLHVLGDELLRLYGGSRDPGFARFLLSFIQSLPYVADPRKPGDWPRFPSEYILNNGGDCEDSSMAYLFLLKKFSYEAAFFLMDSHAAVGVEGPFEGSSQLGRNGRKYHYAETATQYTGKATEAGKYLALGKESREVGPITVFPFFSRKVPVQAPVQILSARLLPPNLSQLALTLASRNPQPGPLRVAAYARLVKDPFDRGAEAVPLDAVELPLQKGPRQTVRIQFGLDYEKLQGGRYLIDIVAWSADKQPLGRWLGAANVNLPPKPG